MVIDLAIEREKRKKQKENIFVKLPIVTRVYEVDGEIKFEIGGYIDTPISWLKEK